MPGKDAVIPSYVTAIEKYAFEGYEGTEFTIPDGITVIGDCAFDYVYTLTAVTIPVSVTEIGIYAFMGDKSLTTINYKGTEEQWNAIIKHFSWNTDVSSDCTVVYNYTGA